MEQLSALRWLLQEPQAPVGATGPQHLCDGWSSPSVCLRTPPVCAPQLSITTRPVHVSEQDVCVHVSYSENQSILNFIIPHNNMKHKLKSRLQEKYQ